MKSALFLPMVVVVCLFLPSCSWGPQPFTVSPISDKFSDPKAPSGISGTNNRLSQKSSQGGVHIDDRGVYLNPYALKNRQAGEIIEVGFSVSHSSFTPDDGFRPIEEIVFLTDRNERISLKISGWDSDFKVSSWNTISKSYNTAYSESGTGTISVEDFARLANAKSVDVKIRGGKLSQTYAAKEISPGFLPNLRQFRDALVR